MIRKLKTGEYRLYSRKTDPKTGKRRNLGTFGSREAAEVSTFDFKVEKSDPAPIKMTPLDKKFLRSLKITVEEEE